MPDYAGRIERVRAAMAAQGIDLLFLAPTANLQYFTGIERGGPNFGDVNYPGGWIAGAYLSLDRGPVLTFPRMVAEFDLEALPGADLRVLPDAGDPAALVRDVLRSFGTVRRIAVDNRTWAETVIGLHAVLPDADLLPARPLIQPLRIVKDDEEIATMRKAARIADATMGAVIPQLHAGMTETDVNSLVETEMARFGSQYPSFGTHCFVMGPNGDADVGHRANLTLKAGDSLSFDFGCVVDGYCSDYGRTVHIGEPKQEFVRVYDLVMRAQETAIAAMRAGQITAAGLNRVARVVIEEAGYGQGFRHRLGHGIGLDVHEPAYLLDGDTTLLESGMAYTIEPSVFIPGQVGTRVEDVVIVTPDGGTPLSDQHRSLTIIPA
jgi:D-alanyl-D-alanine dipeptidase